MPHYLRAANLQNFSGKTRWNWSHECTNFWGKDDSNLRDHECTNFWDQQAGTRMMFGETVQFEDL
ncbi:MAG: hypothetical protein DWQ02_02965 [Bacteroidetes bacterium]|nr:MAG: hypothetical protein DWQ02_02965 [Bacteroidota bacterium]